MTLKQTESGEVLRLGYKDWLGLIILITGGVVSLYVRMEMIDRQSETRVDALRGELSRESPAPARWTVDAVNRIDGDIADLRKAIADITRIDANQKMVMQKLDTTATKLDSTIEGIAENRALLMMLKDRLGAR